MSRNYAIGIILCILGGAFGLQHFYVGRIGYGILSIIFFWTLAPLFVSLIELIYWLTIGKDTWLYNYKTNNYE